MKDFSDIVVREIEVPNILLACRQENFDFVINPYTGCPHACKYCYASFMRRFSRHEEQWGEFIDIKRFNGSFNPNKLQGKRILISSVTEPYNNFEKEYKVTRDILKKLAEIDCEITINTKSPLVLRDIDVLKKLKNVTVSISICTLDKKMASEVEEAYPLEERLTALKKLYTSGIKTCVNIAPIFPYLTDWKGIIEKTKKYTNEYIFESLTLRNEFKPVILNYIWTNYKDLYPKYYEIYKENNLDLFEKLFEEIDDYCEAENLKYSSNIKVE